MKCPESGTIQAYIDGELNIGIRKDLETHIGDCEKCRSVFESLKENDNFAFEKLTYYRVNAMDISAVSRNSKGANGFMQKYRKYIAAACAAAVLAACISIQPVRAVISNALSIFRVDNFKGLKITPEELTQLKETLSRGQGDFTLDKIGRIKMVGCQAKAVSMAELKNSCSFPVISASGMKDENADIKLIEPGTVSFTLNAGNVNTILESFKAKELLPDEVDGKTFSASFGAQASVKYSLNGKTYELLETTSPDMQIPEGVDADRLFSTLVNVPVFPDELKSRLASITDWKNSLYIPLLQDENVSIEEIKLNDKTAYVSTNEGKAAGGADLRSSIIWMDNGAIYGVGSNTGKDDIIRFSGDLK